MKDAWAKKIRRVRIGIVVIAVNVKRNVKRMIVTVTRRSVLTVTALRRSITVGIGMMNMIIIVTALRRNIMMMIRKNIIMMIGMIRRIMNVIVIKRILTIHTIMIKRMIMVAALLNVIAVATKDTASEVSSPVITKKMKVPRYKHSVLY
ncbi:hypothetical protein [Halalkalibacter nanhaiisediminis]|uniref:Uncharacterized protein n=1 Tax=Halalkalibacter nanhaiisediminis TaxID=688079 RepID=A0A562Q7C4_9BACI|nr:hypothetical protein [Halalkalibacter nanhaiisediminis]TWI52662.1 hypothetical protein IQ10_03659 [Halalkalibacter nanhaiisediminis]